MTPKSEVAKVDNDTEPQDGGPAVGGQVNGTEDQEIEEDVQDEPVEEGSPDSDQETEVGAGPEDGGMEPKAGGQTEQMIAAIQALLEAKKNSEEKPKEEAPKQLSDEQWAKLEEDWGGMPRTAIQKIGSSNMRVIQHIMGEMDKRFAKFEKESALEVLSQNPQFRDIKSYKAGIDEFLNNFPVENHANPKLLEMAAIYARGKKAPEQMKQYTEGTERNKKVIMNNKMASPSSGGKSASTSMQLTPLERSAAKAYGVSEKEYVRLRDEAKKNKR